MPRTTAVRLNYRGLILPALCGALALGACGAPNDKAPAAGASTATSNAASAPAGGATTTAASGSGATTPDSTLLADGKHDAYLTRVDTDARSVTFDKVELLTGDAAVKAYQKANPGATDGPPDDYFMVNNNKLLRTMSVSDTVKVEVIKAGNGAATTPSSFAKLPAFLADNDNSTLFELTVKNREITVMKSIYLP